MNTDKKDIIYEDLSYKIIGAIYEVYNSLGYGHRERTYQKALSEEFKIRQLSFKKEQYFPIYFKGKLVSRYFFDFVIENKIVLELKVAKDFYQSDVSQVLAYLKADNYRLGILAVLTDREVKIKRIIN